MISSGLACRIPNEASFVSKIHRRRSMCQQLRICIGRSAVIYCILWKAGQASVHAGQKTSREASGAASATQHHGNQPMT